MLPKKPHPRRKATYTAKNPELDRIFYFSVNDLAVFGKAFSMLVGIKISQQPVDNSAEPE